ncbi:MAG: glycosyltransferase family 4 protein [Rhizobiaceae bacterium]|nr:glycosyltransferase family 4 protein [Rhizobiaceae bacterium]
MRLGVYLGIAPIAGGMFQYAQAILDALVTHAPADWQLCAAYLASDWEPVLSQYPRIAASAVPNPEFAQRMASGLMAARVPPSVCRAISSLNPAAKILGALDCDVWMFPGQDPLSFQTGERAIITIHDLMHRYEPHYPEVSESGRYAIREHRFSSIARVAERVLVDSEVGKQHVVDSYGADPAKIRVLPYIPPAYIYDASVPEDFEERYPLPDKFLFYPAQFWAHKNHANLLQALAASREEKTDIHIIFSGGTAHEYDRVKALATELSLQVNVSFVGYVPDVYLKGFFERARGMIYPTAFGPTNIPPLEAFVCGCPVAASGIYAMGEQLGDAALLFDPSDVQSIKRVAIALWNDDALCADLKEKGFAHARSWGRTQFGQRLTGILTELRTVQ